MTDGEFNTAFAGVPKKGDRTGGQAALSSAYAEHLCDEMKTDGIEIFTIGFMLQGGRRQGRAQRLRFDPMPSRSSTIIETSTGEELNAAFLDIARNIESLAITE